MRFWRRRLWGEHGATRPALRAYPNPVPEDTSFDTVVKSQPFPFMKYPVTIIGAKVHPEEFHLTPSGQLILPYGSDWKGLCVVALVGTRTGDAAGRIEPALPPAEGVTSKLVEGCLPAVENEWKAGDLRLRQLAFATCGGQFESTTGKEPLIALLRYTLTNESPGAKEAVLAIQFGEAHAGMSVKAVPPVYPRELSFESPYVRQKDGPYVACLLTKEPERRVQTHRATEARGRASFLTKRKRW